MMDRLAKAQKSWLSKLILILTALSFMSLFGVSGYIMGANNNKPVIKVDDILISQNEFAMLFEQEQQMARSLFGDNLEINDSIRNAMLQGLVQRELTNAVMQRTAEKYHIVIGDELIRKIIYSQAEFLDGNGNFSIDRLRRVLSASGWTENKYINSLKKDIIKQQIIQNPVANVNVPKVLAENLAKVENQQKVFKYITVSPSKMKIDRKISQEEKEQYYQDFNSNFVEPEKRDVSFVLLSLEDIANQYTPDEADIEAYYQENISQFEVPETRNVLQMVFENKENADKALTELNNGKDFYAVAAGMAQQSKELTELGYVSKDMLVADMADDVFASSKGAISGPTESEMGWHIMKVADIKSGSKMNKAEAKQKIIATLRKERAYDEAYSVSAKIEDKVGGGAALEEIAKENNAQIYQIKGLSEDGKAAKAPAMHGNIVKSTDFVDAAFSYNVNEISQVIETDEGFALVRVDNVIDAHPIAIEKVSDEIEAMWAISERSAIAQEIVNDVMHDLENGESIDEVAQRFGLKLKMTQPIHRSENFEGLSQQSMIDLFQESLGSPKLLSQDDSKMIVIASKTIGGNETPSASDLDGITRRAKIDLAQDFANQMVESFGEDYDVRVKYRLIGMAD